MDDSELEGVMAHEMGHVKNYDIRVSLVVFGLVIAIGLVADIIFRMIFWADAVATATSADRRPHRAGNRSRRGDPRTIVAAVVQRRCPVSASTSPTRRAR